jgi:hypothetical protein
MKTHLLPKFRIGLRLSLLLLAGIFLGTASSLSAAKGSWRSLNLKIAADRQTATVMVPEGIASVSLQSCQRPGGWKTVTSHDGVAGSFTFDLTSDSKKIQWRALGWYVGGAMSRDKFPAKFYQGQKRFGPIKSAAASHPASVGLDYMRALPMMMQSTAVNDQAPTSIPVEADIWKVEGKTVYFFNQLRGLQVLDLTDPKDPRLMASLRLPAIGQDLYMLPETQEDRTVVLLTQGGSWGADQWTRINLVKISGGRAEITFTQDIPGSLEDSRLVGNRLVLATTEWDSQCHLTEWQLSEDHPPLAAGETWIEGDRPLISSGPDWLAVTTSPSGLWNASDVSVFAIRSAGLVQMAGGIRTEGVISNKYRIQWSNNVLTAISESRSSDSDRAPKTIIENFRAWSPEAVHPMVVEDRVLGRIELTEANGESLYATRFAGNKAYVVTFRQTDPLWVVDLTDPLNPVVAGHLEVPGWSSYLQPIGDLLFSIGMESGRVAASLFDVANPADPKLLRRLNLGDWGSFSEAVWNDKALKVLPDAGLAMIPLSASYWSSGQSGVQLLDIDLVNHDLILRGFIAHEFDARRADLIGNSVVSISQRVMAVADISDRDAPAMVSEVSLAWPVNRVLEVGAHLYQIEDGQSFGEGRASLRVSPATLPEQILAEIDLGEGTVKAAEYRDGKFYVLRQIGSASPWVYWARFMGDGGNQANQLILDIYDASTAPELTLLGTCSVNPKSGAQLVSNRLLWPQPNRPAVAISYQYSYWFGIYQNDIVMPMTMMAEPVRVSSKKKGFLATVNSLKNKPSVQPYWPSVQPYWLPQEAPQLLVFDVSMPDSPVAQAPVDLGPLGSMLNDACDAADGLVVAGITRWRDGDSGPWLDSDQAYQSVSVVKVASLGTPVVRPLIDLPGELFAVSELDSKGFLAFTRTVDSQGAKTVQVSASDGIDAFLVASLAEPADAVSIVGGRRIYTTFADGVERRLLGNAGTWIKEPSLDIGWQPSNLRWTQGVIAGTKWDSIFAAGAEDEAAKVWDFSTWTFELGRVSIAADGDLLVPFGDYGTERLDR